MFKGTILVLFCIFKKIFDAVFYITVAVFIMKYFGLFVIYEQLDKQIDYKDLFIVFFNSSSDPIIDSIKKFTTVNDTYKATDKSIVANTITLVVLSS